MNYHHNVIDIDIDHTTTTVDDDHLGDNATTTTLDDGIMMRTRAPVFDALTTTRQPPLR
jgi:hypothetical protein